MNESEILEIKTNIKNLEMKIKIIEILLSRNIENYAEEILKIYWSLGKNQSLQIDKENNDSI